MKPGGNQAAVRSFGRSGSHRRGLTPSSTEDTGGERERRKHVFSLPSAFKSPAYASHWLNQVVRHRDRYSFCDEQSGRNSGKEAESSLTNNPYKILF